MATVLLTPQEVAARLRLSPSTVYAWLRSGRMPGIKLGRAWRVRARGILTHDHHFAQEGSTVLLCAEGR